MSHYLKIKTAFAVGTAFMFATFLFVPALVAGDSFSIMKEQELHLFSEPLDLAISSDGSWTFVLTKSGMVTIYGASGDLIQSLKVGKGYNSIEYSPTGNKLLLSGSGKQELKILTLSMLYELDYKGSPFKGPPNAPVTIAVFNDFQ
ncbi:MAG: hypothetical protein RRA15_09190 [bacterium]|nr:hypothetical protein [bacterium]MDT8366656.1 hypothetical protein [bacterium]